MYLAHPVRIQIEQPLVEPFQCGLLVRHLTFRQPRLRVSRYTHKVLAEAWIRLAELAIADE